MEKLELLDCQSKFYGAPSPGMLHEYSVQQYFKSKFVENDIFIVQFKNSTGTIRMGWIFPIIAIGSDSHDYYGNSHFPNYAKVAAAYVERNLPDVINEDSHLLVLKDDILVKNEIFIDNFDISLMKYGYYRSASADVYSNKHLAVDYKSTTNLVLSKTAKIADLDIYITNLLINILPSTKEHISRFICIYQAFEMLMECYYNDKIDELRSKRNTIGTIREKLQEYSSERKLLNGLFSEYSINRSLNTDEINLVQNIFTTYKEQSYYDNLTLPNYIYDIRNVIVHNYYKYELATLMSEIADLMESILVDILHNEKVVNSIRRSA